MAATGRAQDFNLVRDFTAASNPSGAWTLGWKETLTGTFTPVTFVGAGFADNGVPFYAWSVEQFVLPGFYFYPLTNSTTATNAGGQGVHPPGSVLFFAGEAAPQNYAVIRFTAPSNGLYRVSSRVQHYLDGHLAADTEFHIHHNGTALLDQFLAPHEVSGLTNLLTLTAGSKVDFAVGRGADNVLAESGLEIEVLIEPASLWALPFITQHPESLTVKAGQKARFHVVAASPAPVRYQWYFEGEPIPGETASTLSIKSVHPEMAGAYTVRASNRAGSVWSAAVLRLRAGR